MTEGEPDWRPGKICYIEIPATDISRSAEFYGQVFEWNIRKREDGAVAFDDTVGVVSGTFMEDRPPAADPGLLIYVMVADADAAVTKVVAAGGEIVRPVDPDADVVFAWFKDPGGNVLGLYQQPGLT